MYQNIGKNNYLSVINIVDLMILNKLHTITIEFFTRNKNKSIHQLLIFVLYIII